MLLWPDRTIQSAGVFLTNDVGIERHAFRNAAEGDPGYFGLALTQRNVIAINGACFLTRRDVFERLDGFNENHRVVNNETDYCFRAWRRGLLLVFTPYSKIIHHERASRNREGEDYDAGDFKKQWRTLFADGDPYHHPNLSKDFDRFTPEPEPLRVVRPGHPLLNHKAIQRILLVKLDHIGDCITSFPAIRRLKEAFPHASMRVLAGHWTKPIWSLAEMIEEVIEFDFFHPQSDDGIRDVTEAEFQSLRQRLAPYHFDLAVDLRRHPQTRDILQFTGARFLAGFDAQGRFPWLDIALDWVGDVKRVPKRGHAADELMNLADAICAACEPEHPIITRRFSGPLPLSEPVRSWLFTRRVVCVHPGAGGTLKQWPPDYFAELIDILVEREQVNVVLIGGTAEKAITSRVLRSVRNPWAVVDLIGEPVNKLAQLHNLLLHCALFVGNDSGPKHLAGALGVPTVGIHSGQLDAREWGPVGPQAIALRREMECSPCYLTEPARCPRNIACLTGLRPGEVYKACKRLLAIGARTELSYHADPPRLPPELPTQTGAIAHSHELPPKPKVGPQTIDLERWRSEVALVDPTAAVALERPIGIFVHLFYEDLADEIASYLTCINLPKKIYVSTASEEKRDLIARAFERFGIAAVSEFTITSNYGYDIAPFLIQFTDRHSEHDICLKIHGKKSLNAPFELGEGWRGHLYDELMGDTERAQAIVATMLTNGEFGLLMPEHYYRVMHHIGIGPNYAPMQKILSAIDINLLPNQKIEHPSGSMFWFRAEALAGLMGLRLNLSDFEHGMGQRDGTLAHAMERCFLFFCAHAGKRWGFLPSRPTGLKIPRDRAIRLIRESGAFDEVYYRTSSPDVTELGVDPIEHWVDVGWQEGRVPSDPRNANPVVYRLLEHHLRGLPRRQRFAPSTYAKILDHSARESNESHEQSRSGAWTQVTNAEIRCMKQPRFSGEVALFVTHSPNGRLKPHVYHYMDSLRRNGVPVVLIVATDTRFTIDGNLVDMTDGIFVRHNQGYDFAAWAHVLRLHSQFCSATILYLVNDSLIGPTNDESFGHILHRLRNSPADVIGLTENYEIRWHLQSYFLALRSRVVSSVLFQQFIQSVVSYEDKVDVIYRYEIPLAPSLAAAGFKCEAMFRAIDSQNLTTHHWKYLFRSGFPFIKTAVIRGIVEGVDTSDWREVLTEAGTDISLAERALAQERGVAP
jgi:lipopolysaccharide biosynthesis protein/ADP-heptose:LPS heptosyltransferase